MEYADILNSRRPSKQKNRREESLDIFAMDTSRLIKNILNDYFRNEMEIEEKRENIQKYGIDLSEVYDMMTSSDLNVSKVNSNPYDSCIDYLINQEYRLQRVTYCI